MIYTIKNIEQMVADANPERVEVLGLQPQFVHSAERAGKYIVITLTSGIRIKIKSW